MDTIVAAALYRGPRVLLCHRTPARRSHPDVWDFAGGHVEAGESLHAALARELREELAVVVTEADLAGRPRREVAGEGFHMSLWRLDAWVGEPVNAATHEHDDVRWFHVADALGLVLAHPTYPPLLREWAALA